MIAGRLCGTVRRLSCLVRHPGLYRAQLSCQIGRDILEGKTATPDGVQPIEWAMFTLLHAVEEIATAMMPTATIPPARTCGTCIRYDSTGYCTLWGRAKDEQSEACRQYDGGKDGNEGRNPPQ